MCEVEEAKEHISTGKLGGIDKKLKEFISFLIDNKEEIVHSIGEDQSKFRISIKKIDKHTQEINDKIGGKTESTTRSRKHSIS